MNNYTHRQLAVEALNAMRGDDGYRARNAFKGCTEKEMGVLYGHTGLTRAQVLAQCESREDMFDSAIEWVKNAK